MQALTYPHVLLRAFSLSKNAELPADVLQKKKHTVIPAKAGMTVR
jgi:hypothetical protein